MSYVCSVCGYVHEGDEPPEACPVCKAPKEKFKKQEGDLTWAAEHVVVGAVHSNCASVDNLLVHRQTVPEA